MKLRLGWVGWVVSEGGSHDGRVEVDGIVVRMLERYS